MDKMDRASLLARYRDLGLRYGDSSPLESILLESILFEIKNKHEIRCLIGEKHIRFIPCSYVFLREQQMLWFIAEPAAQKIVLQVMIAEVGLMMTLLFTFYVNRQHKLRFIHIDPLDLLYEIKPREILNPLVKPLMRMFLGDETVCIRGRVKNGKFIRAHLKDRKESTPNE